MRLCLLASLLLACNSAPDQSCSVSELANGDVSSIPYNNCGTFVVGDPNYTDEAMNAAQLCVLNAASHMTSFLLVYAAADSTGMIDSVDNLAAAWTASLSMSGVYSLHSYAGQGVSGDMEMKEVSEFAWPSVTASASCTPKAGAPCLTCVNSMAMPGVPTGGIACRR